jgi:hypothetical protein
MECSAGSHEDVCDILLRFIEAYRDLPILWDVFLKYFSNIDNTVGACDELDAILK